MVLHLDTAKEPSLQNLIGFVEVKPRSAVFVRNLQNLLQNPGVWFILYESYLGFVRNLKRFRSEGSFAVFR